MTALNLLLGALIVSIAVSSVCAVAISRRDHRALDRRNAERNRRKHS